jgi:hypothetical protein
MNKFIQIISLLTAINVVGCAHVPVGGSSASEAVKLDRKLVRDAVVFEDGAKDGAVVPEISSPQLRAIMIPERVENNRLIEAHREWVLDGDVSILGIPRDQTKQYRGKRK